MKKILCSLLAVLMLASALLITPVSAEGIADNLVVDIDFEGNEPLKDKATAGASDESMSLVSDIAQWTQAGAKFDTELAELTKVEGGRLFISTDANDRGEILIDADNTDIVGATELTFYFEAEMLGWMTSWNDFLHVRAFNTEKGNRQRHLVRAYAIDDRESGSYHTDGVQHLTTRYAQYYTTKDGNNNDSIIANIIPGETICYAASVKFDGTNWKFNFMYSMDSGKTWVESPFTKAVSDVGFANGFAAINRITIGKGDTPLARGGTMAFECLKVYNKALTLDDVKGQISEETKAAKADLYEGVQYRPYTKTINDVETAVYDIRVIAKIDNTVDAAGIVLTSGVAFPYVKDGKTKYYDTDNQFNSDGTIKELRGKWNEYDVEVSRYYTSLQAGDGVEEAGDGKGFIVLVLKGVPATELPVLHVKPWTADAAGNVTWGKTAQVTVTAADIAA